MTIQPTYPKLAAPPTEPAGAADRTAPDETIGLAELLDAWNVATTRLQRTHETLREEVHRLTEELEEKNRQLARKNRLADLGQMASHVAHEIRNSLMPITLYLSLLRRRAADDALCDLVGKLEAGFQSLQTTVGDLLQFTSDRQPQWEAIRLDGLVRSLLDDLAPQIEAQGIETSIGIPAGTVLYADENMLRRALLNLVLNALDAMPDGGRLEIDWREDLDGAGRLRVIDDGPGIDPAIRSRLFEPFFTTKREGTGLGLAIVDRIAQVHGGGVSAEPSPRGGSVFTIEIPPARKEAVA